MTYEQFKHQIHATLHQYPSGMTWSQLRDRLELPYNRPCPEWTRRLEDEIGLTRRKGTTRAFVWSCVSDDTAASVRSGSEVIHR